MGLHMFKFLFFLTIFATNAFGSITQTNATAQANATGRVRESSE